MLPHSFLCCSARKKILSAKSGTCRYQVWKISICQLMREIPAVQLQESMAWIKIALLEMVFHQHKINQKKRPRPPRLTVVALNTVTLHVVILFTQGGTCKHKLFHLVCCYFSNKKTSWTEGYPRSTKQHKQKNMSAIGSASRYPWDLCQAASLHSVIQQSTASR